MSIFTERDRALKVLAEGMHKTISTSKHRDDFIYMLFSGCIFDIARYDLTQTEWEIVEPYIKYGQITETHLIGAMMADHRFENVTAGSCSIIYGT